MKISAGQRLGSFEVSGVLGKGGMGDVWSACDTKLGRQVALKLLPEDFDTDPDRHARFEREAKLLASLNHPNIATLYGLEHLDDRHVLVMEHVEGEDLSERISRGPIPIDEAIPIALQIAEALEAAHEQNIVHRDLKPANIKLRPDGTVKVLDFGLAKAWDEDHGSPDLSVSPTLSNHATAAGVILGTASYMSPEQARGVAVDRRSDIWSYGAVLWEMLTGQILFEGETVTDVLAAVLTKEPELDALPLNTPPPIRRLLERCLEHEVKNRLQWIGDARLELLDAGSANIVGERIEAPDTGSRPARGILAWTVAASALLLAAIAWWPANEQPAPPTTRFSVDVGIEQTLTFVDVPILDISADGQTLAFIASDLETGHSQIYMRRLGESDARPLAGTEGASNPFFSPNGDHVGFFAHSKLKRIPVDGGSAAILADAPNPRGAVWLPDDTIVFSPTYSSGLWQIEASGGEATVLLDVDLEAGERTFRYPSTLPDGRTLIFTMGMTDSPNNYDEASIVAYSLDTGERNTIVEGANMARFAGSETLVYSRAGVVYATAFDPDRLDATGSVIAAIDDVGGDPTSGAGYFAVSANGTCVWAKGAVAETDALLTIVDRDGSSTRLPLATSGFHQPRFSPDGQKIAVTIGIGQSGVNGDVWVYSLASGAFSRVTFDGNDLSPAWSPDGRRLAYLSFLTAPSIYVKPADGSGRKEEFISSGADPLFPDSFSADGRTLAYTRIGQTTDVFLAQAGEDPQVFETNASGAAFSPDGRWISYSSPSSGSSSIYVRAVDGDGMWQVSPSLGGYSRWSADERRLYYIDISTAKRPLMEVEVEDATTFQMGPPRIVLEELGSRFLTSTAPVTNWDVSPDGNYFVFVEFERDEGAGSQIEVALNWAQNLPIERP